MSDTIDWCESFEKRRVPGLPLRVTVLKCRGRQRRVAQGRSEARALRVADSGVGRRRGSRRAKPRQPNTSTTRRHFKLALYCRVQGWRAGRGRVLWHAAGCSVGRRG
jgi:hypothetical protein